MRRSWWIAALFLAPSVVLTLLLNAALSLRPGAHAPAIGMGFLVLPLVGAAHGARGALARGLWTLASLQLVFSAIVQLRLWTDAGGPVLEREGLVAAARWGLVLAAVAGLGAWALSRRRPDQDRGRRGAGPRPTG